MKNLLLLCSLLLLCHTAYARPNNGGDKDSTRHTVKNPLVETQTLRSFPELDNYLQQNGSLNTMLNVPNVAIAEFTQAYIASNFSVSDFIADNRSQAAQTFAELDRLGSYVDNISPQDLVSLPVGMKKKLGTTSVTIGIAKAKFKNTYAELTIFCKIDLPQGKTIFFGADNVKLTKNGGIFGDARLVLLGDFQIPINGGNSMIVLKGGFNMSTGNVSDVNVTGITVNCSGVKDLKVAADVVFPRSLLDPVDDNLKVISDQSVKVKGSFFTEAGLTDWNDIYVSISSPKFAIHGLSKVCFDVTGAKFDFSDVASPTEQEILSTYGNMPSVRGLWRGVFIKNITVYLPKEFKKKGTNNAVTIAGNNIIIDNWGFTGEISSVISDFQDGTASGWDFSVDKFDIKVQANSLRSAGFQGSIAIPLTKKKVGDTKVEQYGLAYSAVFTADNGYMLKVALKENLPFDLWRAKINLKEGSSVELVARDGAFKPKAILTGTMGIEIVENGEAEAALKGIKFENLILQTEAPYLKGGEFGYVATGSHVSKFPFSISTLSVNVDNLSLTAGFSLNLMENKFAAAGRVTVFGARDDASDGTIGYKYDRLQLDEASAHADFGSFKLDGSIKIMRGHKTMGNGVSGKLSMKLKLQSSNEVGIEVAAAFGTKPALGTVPAYRYWYVDALVSTPPIPVAPGLDLVGLGGGASYRMKRLKDAAKHDAENTFTKVAYEPDYNTSLGLRAMVSLAVKGDAGYVDACLEMAFNAQESGGGLKHIGLFGRGKFMTKESNEILKSDAGMKGKLDAGFTKLTENVGNSSANVAALESGNFTAISENSDLNVVPDEKESADRTSTVYATLAIDYDFATKTLIGNFNIDLLVGPRSQPTMVGTGKMRLKFAPSEWYIYIGEPDPNKRVNVSMNFAAATANLNAYFVVGSHIPNSPPPPAAVASILGQKADALNYMRDLNALSSGAGFAFGASLSVQTGDINFLFFYANFNAGLGFDVMVRKYPNATYSCGNGVNPLGMHGWYANGQAYAYMQGELGVKVTVFGSQQKIPIIKGGAAILLQAKLPNPSWFRGYMAGNYSVLGGVFSGSFNMKIELGKDCTLNPAPPAGPDITFINTITPEHQATEVDVTAIPQVTFSQPINTPFYVSIPNPNDPNNPTYDVYRAVLDSISEQERGFTVKNGTAIIQGTYTYSKYQDAISFTGNTVFTTNTTYTVNVKLKFEKRTSEEGVTPQVWIPYTGSNNTELKTATFTTTDDLSMLIPLSNIEWSYPALGQKYFHPSESTQGFIKFKRGMPQLECSPNTIDVHCYSHTMNTNSSIRANYDVATRILSFPLNNIGTSQTLEISFDQSNSNVCDPHDYGDNTAFVGLTFSTSKYSTFAQKMANKFNAATTTSEYAPNSPTTPLLGATGINDEPFEMNELRGTGATGNKPLVQAEADLTNIYYVSMVAPAVYSWQTSAAIPEYWTRNKKITGLPPTKTLGILPAYEQALSAVNDATTTLNTLLPFRYMAAQYYKEDFMQMREYLFYTYTCPDFFTRTNKQCNPIELPSYLNALNNMHETYFPQMPAGTYPATFKYVLPNGQVGTSYTFNYGAPTPQQNGMSLEAVTVDTSGNRMVISNLRAPRVDVDVYKINNNNGLDSVFSCHNNCAGEQLSINMESNRDYIVNVKMFSTQLQPIGERQIRVNAPPSCDNVTVAVQGTTMTVSNLTAPHQIVNIYRVSVSSFGTFFPSSTFLTNTSPFGVSSIRIPVYNCTDCNQTISTTIDTTSKYVVVVKKLNSYWGLICEREIIYQP